MNNPKKVYKHDKTIENKVREGIRRGLTTSVIMDSMAHWQNMPKSPNTFYKYYGHAIAEEREKLQGEISDAVMQKVREGDTKMIEFAARSRANWNPITQVEEKSKDDPDENKDAISILMDKLGLDDDQEE